uniref:PH domain-containing protein n=1 Tax=Plectus sambesii TaxID=2011161 RepID=A0A914VJG1_9BILA
MKASHQGWVQIQSKGFLHKWKQHYCAIFSTNQFGKARLEIYASEANFELAKNGKTVLLADCISIRPVSISPVNPNGIQIQLNNGTIMMMCLGNAEDTQVWQSALSRAAFPDQHQTTSISHMGSPTPLPSPAVEMPPPSGDEPAYDVPWDLHQFHVLLIANAASIRAKIAEGNYELCFKDSLLLKDGIKGVEAWSYDDITWFGYGDSCFAFQALGSSTFEFKCSRPSDVYEALRTYLRLDNDNNAMPYNLKDNYLVSYVPLERRRAPTVNEGEDFER